MSPLHLLQENLMLIGTMLLACHALLYFLYALSGVWWISVCFLHTILLECKLL